MLDSAPEFTAQDAQNMYDELKRKHNAQLIFKKLIKKLIEEYKLKVNVDEENMLISYFLRDESGLPMEYTILVNGRSQSIRVYSMIPMTVRSEKSRDMARAVCAANLRGVLGWFEYDIDAARVGYVVEQSFMDTELDDRFLDTLIINALERVRTSVARFYALNAGYLTLGEFLAELRNER